MKHLGVCQFNAPALTQIGGIETDLAELSNFLAEKGIEITLVAGSGKQIAELNPKIKIFRYLFLKRKNPLNKLLAKIYPKLLTPYQIECISFWPFAFIHFLKNDYDIIHFHQPIDAIFFNFLKHFKKFKTVLTIHGYPTKTLINAMKKTDLIISVSGYSKRHLEEVGVKSTAIHNPIDLKKFENAKKNAELVKKFGLNGKTVLMSVGRLVEWKGVHFALKAMPLILEENKKAKYLIIGSGLGEKKLKKMALDLNLNESIEFVGRIPNNQLPPYLALCDIFLHPSIQMEALGMSVVEAMSAGKPVITTNIGGVKELIENNKSGYLVEPENEKAIAEKAVELIENKKLREKIGENAKKRIYSIFDSEKLTEKIIAGYQKLLKQ